MSTESVQQGSGPYIISRAAKECRCLLLVHLDVACAVTWLECMLLGESLETLDICAGRKLGQRHAHKVHVRFAHGAQG